MRHPGRPWTVAALGGIAGTLLVPGIVLAHPLGNFTINHYAALRVEPDRVLLDVVVDRAEIPTFQARLGFDADGDGELSDAETDAGRVTACREIEPSLVLTVDRLPQALTLTDAGLTFPPGVGGLSTMRSVCEFSLVLGEPLVGGTRVSFADRSFPERLGWREIVVSGSGVTVAPTGATTLRTTDVSSRLTAYPTNLLSRALADTSVEFVATPGGPFLPPPVTADASPLSAVGAGASAGLTPDTSAPPSPTPAVPGPAAASAVPVAAGVVPGGVGPDDLPSIFRTADLTPWVLLASILTAAALGAGHALTPGHGKTLMAAYLVGTRGKPLHAVGLGLSVTLSHTAGILVLAALVVGAGSLLPADLVVRTAPVVAALSILAIGGWMLAGEVRRRARVRSPGTAVADAGWHDDGGGRAIGHRHDGTDHDRGDPSHRPAGGTSVTWRGLVALGLAGGLIPSTSALLILLGSIAAGRPAFGFVLVVAFGVGMALVMAGVGLTLVLARGPLDRADASSPLGRAGRVVPLVAAVLVFGLGIYLTVQAVGGAATF